MAEDRVQEPRQHVTELAAGRMLGGGPHDSRALVVVGLGDSLERLVAVTGELGHAAVWLGAEQDGAGRDGLRVVGEDIVEVAGQIGGEPAASASIPR